MLVAGAGQFVNEAAVRRAYFRSADSIPSSGDHARTLVALVERGAPDTEALIALLESARGIASSDDKTRVLVAASDRVTGDAVVDAYLETAETVPSSGDQKRALAALIR